MGGGRACGRVSTHSIRCRILKGLLPPPLPSRPVVSTHSIRCRILKGPATRSSRTSKGGFNPFDPMQDTERAWLFGGVSCLLLVSTHSIRCRILKVQPDTGRQHGCQVSTHSIRCRILKVYICKPLILALPSFNPFDPMQDTESMILDNLGIQVARFNPFDPMQDTES